MSADSSSPTWGTVVVKVFLLIKPTLHHVKVCHSRVLVRVDILAQFIETDSLRIKIQLSVPPPASGGPPLSKLRQLIVPNLHMYSRQHSTSNSLYLLKETYKTQQFYKAVIWTARYLLLALTAAHVSLIYSVCVQIKTGRWNGISNIIMIKRWPIVRRLQ